MALLSLAGFWVCLGHMVPRAGKILGKPELVAGLDAGVAQPIQAEIKSEEAAPSPAITPEPPVAPLAVVIDAGHGGADGGTVGNGLLEKDWTLKVGLALAEELRSRGHVVELTRDADQTLPLADRPALVNAVPRVALLSIHFNAGTPDATGVETWYSWPKKPDIMARLHDAEGVPLTGTLPDDGQGLAAAVQAAVQKATGGRDRGIKNREDMAITSRTVCPSVLIECGFLSSGPESRKIQDPAWRKRLVTGIADGFEVWLKSRPALPAGAAPEWPTVPAEAGKPDAEH